MMSGDAYLRFGDVITLESGRNCFLSMDPISLTVLWQLSPDRKNAPVNIENCLWKICPRLSYVDQELFQQSKKLSLSAENAEDIAAQASIEKARNERDFNTIKSAVLFGQVVQLQHVLSGLFLNCMTVPSEQDADCFQLRLGPGSSDAYLKVMSMYKIRADGGNVMLADDVVFSSISIPNHNIYKSAQLSPLVASYGALYDEANLSRNRNTTKICVNLFSRVNLYESRTLCTTQGVRFFDSESNSFIESSCEMRTFVDNHDPSAYLHAVDHSIPFANHPSAVKAAALWTFVTLDRKCCEYVHWEKPYRIKHIPTSKYLTVVAVVETGPKGHDRTVYHLQLEVENPNPQDQTFQVLAVEKPGDYVESSDVMVQLFHNTCGGQRLYVRKGKEFENDYMRTKLYLGEEQNNYDAFMLMEATKDVVEIVKRNYVSWRVAQRYARHFVKDKAPIPTEAVRLEYVAERKQAKRSSMAAVSKSSVTSPRMLTRASSAKMLSLRFADVDDEEEVDESNGGNNHDDDDDDDVDEDTYDDRTDTEAEQLCGFMFKMLKALLFELVVGDQEDDLDVFTLDGECDEVVQNCARDQFILEALLTALVAPVTADCVQEHENNSRVGLLGVKEPVNYQSVHLLGWIVMKHLIKDNENSENYLVHEIDLDSVIVSELKPIIMAKTTTKIKSSDGKPMSFALARIINQIPFRLGASYALTTLISNNKSLLLSFVNDATLLFFRDLISKWGPDKRFIEVFNAICSCKGEALSTNQRKMLKLIKTSNANEPFVIESFRSGEPWSTDNSPMLVSELKDEIDETKGIQDSAASMLRKLTAGDSEEVEFHMDDNMAGEAYLGKDGCEYGFPRLGVTWAGADDWKRGHSSLYYSPAKLNIPHVMEGSKFVVSIQDLAFPSKLEEDTAEGCSEETTFKAIDSFYKTNGDRKLAQQLFVDHKFLSEYFMEQIRLYAEMCLGRCFETRSHLSVEYDFDMLYSGMANTNLPFGYRGAFCELMRTLSLDQFPQLTNCGNHRIPGSVYVLEDLDFKNDDINSSLPVFSIPTKFQSNDALYQCRTPKKFELLVAYCSKYLSARGGAQCSAPCFKNRNRCTLSVVKMIENLLSFGFYDTLSELSDVVRPMVLMLDGRMMTEEVDEKLGYRFSDYKRGVLQPVRNIQTEKRYTIQDSTVDLIDAKLAILKVLRFVKCIRGQFRLTKFLAYFADQRQRKQLESTISATQIATIIDILTDDRLNIETLSGIEYTDTIFIDLLMYEDEEVFEEVLTVMIEEHEPTKALLDNCKQVHFLVNDRLDAPMHSYAVLKSEIWELQQLFSSVEEWCGLRSEVNPASYIRALNILIRLRQYLYCGLVGDHSTFKDNKASKQVKEFLFSLNLHSILFDSLEWDLGTGAVGDDFFSWVEVDSVPDCDISVLVTRSLILLGDLVCDKSREAFANVLTVDYIAAKNKRKPLRKFLFGLLYETFQGSEQQVTRTPEEVVFIFASLLVEPSLRPLALQFFEEQLCPGVYEGIPLYRNQDVIAHSIMDNIKLFTISTVDIANTFNTYVSCMNLVGECCRDNPQNRNLLQFLFPTKTLADRMDTLLHYILQADFRPSALHLPAILFDAYVDVFNVVCLEEASDNEAFATSMRYYVALLHQELKNPARYNVVMVLDPMLKLLRSYCNVQAENGGDTFCLQGMRHICHKILARPKTAADPSGSVWSSTRLLTMDILGLSGDNRSQLHKWPPSPYGAKRCLESPFARKQLVVSYDTSDISGFKRFRAKPLVGKGPLESQKNFFVPALVPSPAPRNVEMVEEMIRQYKDAVDSFNAKIKSELKVDDAPEAELTDTMFGVNPLMGGKQFASMAGSGLMSVTSSVAKAGKASVKSAGSFVADGLEGAVEMGVKLGGLKNSKRSDEAAQDMHLQLELRNFTKRVSHHKSIKRKLVTEKEHVLNLLINAEERTNPNTEDYIKNLQMLEGDMQGGVKTKKGFGSLVNIIGLGTKLDNEVRTNSVSWKDVVLRMVKHVDFKNNRAGTSSTVCSHIIYLFDLYVRGDGTDDGLEERQCNLMDWGVLHLCFRLIKAGKDSPLFVKALVLLTSLLSNGNSMCQQSLQAYMTSSSASDTEGNFFRALFETIQDAATWVQTNQRRRLSSNAVDESVMGVAQLSEIEIFDTTLLFCKEFCEGHNRISQDMLRSQPFNRRTYNVIAAVNDLLDALAPRRDIYQTIGMMPYTLLCSTLDVLVECVQGPCPENQVLCVQMKALEVSKQIIVSHTLCNVAEKVKFNSRLKAIALLSALLENRHDSYIAEQMVSKIESYKLDEFGLQLSNELQKSKDLAKEKKKFRGVMKLNHLVHGASDQDEDEDEDVCDDEDIEEEEMKSVGTVYTAFDPMENVEEYVYELKQGVTCLYNVTKSLDGYYNSVQQGKVGDDSGKVRDHFKSMMCEIDISWNGKVETVNFPVPDEATDLSETTKKDFLNNCDLSTRETRIKCLMDEAENFQNEMEAYNELAEFKFYGWLLDNYLYFKAVVLLIVGILVLNVLFGHISDKHTLDEHRNNVSQLFTVVLSTVSAVGYFIMFLYWLIPQVFIAIKVNKERLVQMRDDIKSGKFVQTWDYNWDVMLLPYKTMPFLVLVAIVHYVAFKDVLNASTSFLVSRYIIMAVVIYIVWLPVSFRKAIVTPNNVMEDVFCIVFDLLTVPAIFEHLGCTLLLILGYNYLYFYAFVLLDVVSMSEHMKNAVRAVTRPISSLCSVFVLFVLVVLIFAILGFFIFDEPFIINGEELGFDDAGTLVGEDNSFCSSPMGCFWTVAYGAVRAGDIAEIMTDISPDQGSHYFIRMVFDMLFFIILGVLLFDMVTGIIVDTFVSLREETVEREGILKNQVFVSGITQEMCADKDVSFRDHQDAYQNTWNYVYFYVYLTKSDKTALNGAEHYVWHCIQEGDISWFPRLTSSTLQNVDESSTEAVLSELCDRMTRLESSLSQVNGKLDGLSA